MFRKLISISTSLFILLGATQTANAGLILYSDRESFEEAVTGNLSFEGFNSVDTLNEDLTVNKSRYRTTTSLVSEGEKALSISENSVLTVTFDHDVFAFGFDLNELNSTNLDYLDDAGNEILNALLVTQVWNESTFFGLISDTAIRSFSLTGTGSNTAAYGFDALSYTASPTQVPTPQSLILFILAIGGMFLTTRLNKN